MFVHARLNAGVNANAILAPQQGVTRDLKGSPTALVVNQENKVELRQLKASRTLGSDWLIEEGLNPGDRLITEGLQYVRPGVEVKVSEATNVKKPGSPDQPTRRKQTPKRSKPCRSSLSIARSSPG